MRTNRQRSAWIIGAGYLGKELAKQCRAEGWSVLTIDKRAADLEGDAADPETLRRAMELLPEPDGIFCCTATHGGSVQDYRCAYGDVVSNVTRFCRGERIVFCSSTGVYEGKGGESVTEQNRCPGSSERRRILLEAERKVIDCGGKVVRLAALYGAGRCELVRRYLTGEPKLGGGEQRVVNYLHVSDAASALRVICDRGCEGIYNASGESLTLQEAYAMLAEVLGERKCEEPEVASGGCRGRTDQRVNCDKLRGLGWSPRRTLRSEVQERREGT